MSDEQSINVLNRLLEAETGSLIPRLGEADPFVDWPAAEGRALIARMLARNEEHKRGLAELIFRLRGTPAMPRRSITTSGVHYVQLTHLMPDIVASVRRLVETYESVGDVVNPEAGVLIARILQDHRQHLRELEQLSADQTQSVQQE